MSDQGQDQSRLMLYPFVDALDPVLSAPEHVIDPLIPRDVVTLLGGHGGAGKSLLALTLAAHVCAGHPWGGLEVKRGVAVYVTLEDPAELVLWRLGRVTRYYGLDPVDMETRFRLYDGSGRDNALAVERVAGGVRSLSDGPAMDEFREAMAISTLGVVDNATDAFHGDENNRNLVRSFMRRLSAVAQESNAAVLLLAHIDKAGARAGTAGQSYSGSTAWHNSARSRLALIAEGDQLELRHEKANLSALAQPIRLRWDGPMLVPDAIELAQVKREHQLAGDAEAILGVIRVALEAGMTVPATLSGPTSAAHTLEGFPELDDNLRGKDGRGRIRAALIQLLRDGRIVKERYRKPNRHPAERLALAQKSVSGCAEKCVASHPPYPPTSTGALGECAPVTSRSGENVLTHTDALTHSDHDTTANGRSA